MRRTCVHCREGFEGYRSAKFCSPRCNLLSKCERIDTGCWIWKGTKGGVGYGVLWPNGKAGGSVGAHRCSYETFVGPIPETMQVCHRCDVRACINPDHLFLGTIGDNMRDRTAKGRQARGERNGGGVKLSEEKVRRIRGDRRSLNAVASDYGVSISLISQVRNRTIWKHVE